MRLNEPVTQRAFDIPDSATLMSTTDAQSHVTYANEAFVAISGFSREEIYGQPHNFVRHPDMPKEAFADMWATLRGGEPWTALVKNRRKNGDHYWVRANAVPVVRDGRQVGYMSVRTKPTQDDVARAEALYREIREGRSGNRRFHKGLLVRSGLASVFSLGQKASVRARIRLTMAVVWTSGTLAAMAMSSSSAELLGLSAGLAAVSLMASLLLESQIAKPLDTLLGQALGVATGANRSVAHMNRVDEIGMAMRTVSQLGLMFRWLIDDVSQQVMTLQTAITEIAQGNNDLSSRTEQAAASVEQTASAMAQMTGTVKNNADTRSRPTSSRGRPARRLPRVALPLRRSWRRCTTSRPVQSGSLTSSA